MAEIAISVEHLDKMYKLYDKPMDRLKESLGLTRKKKYREHYAFVMCPLRCTVERRWELSVPMVRGSQPSLRL